MPQDKFREWKNKSEKCARLTIFSFCVCRQWPNQQPHADPSLSPPPSVFFRPHRVTSPSSTAAEKTGRNPGCFSALWYTRSMRILAISLMTAVVFIPAVRAQQAGGSIDVPAGTSVLLQAKGDGVQIYTCADSPGGAKWTLTGPDAKLLDAAGKTIGSHFAGPTWKLDNGGQVQGALVASKPSPEAGSVAWLLLRAKPGTGTGSLADVALVRRTETHGGVAPALGCTGSPDAGKTVRVPYTATYTFYTDSTRR